MSSYKHDNCEYYATKDCPYRKEDAMAKIIGNWIPSDDPNMNIIDFDAVEKICADCSDFKSVEQ